MTDVSNYLLHKVLLEARIADRQRELAAQAIRRRNRQKRWATVRLATARGLHRLARAIEPASRVRLPAQRKPA